MAPPLSGRERGTEIMVNQDERKVNMTAVEWLGELEAVAYRQITGLISEGRYHDAEQIADILIKVGII